MTAACERCGQLVEIKPKTRPRRFCSDTCRKAAHKSQRAANQPTRSGRALPADSCAAGPKAGGGVESAVPAQPVAGATDLSSPSGLVICATTARDLEEPQVTAFSIDIDAVRQFWDPRFPSPELLARSADMFDHGRLPVWDGSEGPRWRVEISPGSIGVRSRDLARRERTQERWLVARAVYSAHAAAYFAEHGVYPPALVSTREITSWSAKSRAKMVEVYLQLDYTPMFTDVSRIPAMWTLTYPGDWVTVAPNGKAFKRHIRAFLERFRRAWGYQVVGLWKAEFQRRGAPHAHIFAPVPHGVAKGGGRGKGLTFKRWLSVVWADVVAHPDPVHRQLHENSGTRVDYAEGLKSNDPRRIAVYFSHHSSYSAKEYQNCVPEEWQAPGQGPGRFWGYWGLKRVVEVVELEPRQATAAARVARRWARAQGRAQLAAQVVRCGGVCPAEGWFRQGRRMAGNRGFVSVNDGAEFASQLARAIRMPAKEPAVDRRARLLAAQATMADRRAQLVAATGSIQRRRVLSQVSVGVKKFSRRWVRVPSGFGGLPPWPGRRQEAGAVFRRMASRT